MAAPRKPVKVVVTPASPDAIRRALKVSASDVKAAQRVIAKRGLDQVIRRVLKLPDSPRGAPAGGARPLDRSR